MRHLNDIGFAALVAGDGDQAALEHVAGCASCAAEVRRVRAFTGEFRAAMLAAEPGVMPALIRPAGVAWRWGATAAAFACIVLLAAALLHHAPTPRAATAAPVAQKDISDDLLLLEIEGDISRSGPKALAPASLITQARNKQAQTYAVKETQ